MKFEPVPSTTSIDTIVSEASVFIGKPLTDCWRAPNEVIQVFEFGPQLPFINTQGDHITRAALALHVTCNWRIISGSTLVVGADDLGDNDDPKVNLLDRKVTKFFSNREPPVVESVEADSVGGLIVRMSGQTRIEVVPSETGDVEWWRIVPRDPNAEHFVVTGIECYRSAPVDEVDDESSPPMETESET